MGRDDAILTASPDQQSTRTMKNKDVDFPRIGFILGGIAVGLVAGWIWGPAMPGRGQALQLLTVFSLLFGMVMMAIISLGDSTKLFGTSWRAASEHGRRNRRSMQRYMALLYIYFLTVGLAFASSIISGPYPAVALGFDRAAIFVGAVAFVWSLAVPLAVYRRNMEQLDSEADRRLKRDTTEQKTS